MKTAMTTIFVYDQQFCMATINTLSVTGYMVNTALMVATNKVDHAHDKFIGFDRILIIYDHN